jgi:hypothetical protein
MKQLFSVLVILCWLTPPLQSQPNPQRDMGGGRLETFKIGWLSRRLALTSEEAQKFWPIYGVYTKEVQQAYQVYHNDKNQLELEESLLNIKKKYSLEFVKAIPPGKINDFFRAEVEFNEMVRREMIRRQQMQGRPYPAPPN